MPPVFATRTTCNWGVGVGAGVGGAGGSVGGFGGGAGVGVAGVVSLGVTTGVGWMVGLGLGVGKLARTGGRARPAFRNARVATAPISPSRNRLLRICQAVSRSRRPCE